MKPRARRVTITAAILAVAIVAVLTIAYWSTVRDHFEAWWFVLTRETIALSPRPWKKPVGSWIEREKRNYPAEELFQEIANMTQLTVIFDPAAIPDVRFHSSTIFDYRRVKQRFPRPAWVVVGYPEKENPR